MSTLVTLWWLLFWTTLGLCVGSFLNAVIYRLPRNRSLRSPLWSICPTCGHRIRWYDNIPIVSFLLLRGRCRHCGIHISPRYLVIEVSMALVVLMLLDAFFVGGVRSGLSKSPFGLTDRLSYDWPILLAHVTLFACLLPMSVIDLEHYWVDVRFTNLATIVGFALHTLWIPKHSMEWIRPLDTTAVMSVCAVAGLGIVWLILICQPHADREASNEEEDRESPPTVAPVSNRCSTVRRPRPTLLPPSRAGGWIALFLLVATFAALFVDETGKVELRHTGRAMLPLLLFLGLIIRESAVSRASDRRIANAIHEERYGARRMAIREFGLLLPAVGAAAVGWWVMVGTSDLSSGLSRTLHAELHMGGLRHWTPQYGLATAASGYIIAGALGWSVRIVFTLLFGKEAFGSGDIHLMAAAGAVAGWPVVVLGFFLTCGLAMIGYLASLPFKRTRALPLGPWLSLSFLTVVVYYDSIIRLPIVARVIDTANMLFFRNSQLPVFESIR